MTPVQRNPFRERHELRADISKARQAGDAIRSKLARLSAERREVEATALREEMEILAGTEGATERRDAAVERLHSADRIKPELERGLTAAEQLLQVREAELKRLYEDGDAFSSFATEAEAATAGAVLELETLRQQVGRASQAWAKATALWRPLNAALRRQLEELNSAEGSYPNVAPQAVAPVFPVATPRDFEAAAPRPPGVERLRAAGRL